MCSSCLSPSFLGKRSIGGLCCGARIKKEFLALPRYLEYLPGVPQVSLPALHSLPGTALTQPLMVSHSKPLTVS